MKNTIPRNRWLGGARIPLLKLLVLTLLAALFCPMLKGVTAAGGDLDTTFGSGGRVITDIAGLTIDQARSVAIQSDGKVLAAGFAFVGPQDPDFALVRYNADGSLDAGFGNGGKVLTNFGGQDIALAIAVQTNGKIILAGASGFDFGLARYNANGSLDTTFGNGGKVTTDLSANDEVHAMALQTDGKIVAAGSATPLVGSQSFALARYNTDGSLDATFGAGGTITTDFFGFIDSADDVAIQPDGRIIAAGQSYSQPFPDFTDFALARYNTDGSLDTTFGSGGKVTTDFSGFRDEGRSLVLQRDGRIVVSGAAVGQSGATDFALARYKSDGALDPTFGIGGKVTTDFFGGFESANDSAIYPNGKIVLAGGAGTRFGPAGFGLAQYDVNGMLDPTFGIGGKITTVFPSNAFGAGALAMAIQSDGKIVAAGLVVVRDTDSDFALARYEGSQGNGFDLCLQDDGNGSILELNSATGGYRFTNCRGFTVAGTGTVSTRGSMITVQHSASDRRVMAKIDSSVSKGTASIQVFSQGATFTIIDKSLSNNSCLCP